MFDCLFNLGRPMKKGSVFSPSICQVDLAFSLHVSCWISNSSSKAIKAFLLQNQIIIFSMRIKIFLKPRQIIHSINDFVIDIAKDISVPINKLSLNFLQLLIQDIYGTAKPGSIPSIRDQLLTIRVLQQHRSNFKRKRIPFG